MIRRERFERWVKRWGVTTASIIAAGAAAYGAIFVSLVGEDARWIFISTALVGAVVAAGLPAIETKKLNDKIVQRDQDLAAANQSAADVRRAALKEGRADFIFVLDKAVQPLLRKLGPVIRAKYAQDRERFAAKLQQSAVFALLRVIDPVNPTMRANYFKMQDPLSPQGYLSAESTTGVLPRSKFKINDLTQAYSASMRKMMAEDGYIASRDTSIDPPAGFGPPGNHTYKSFVSAPATDGVGNDGMITIDSPHADALDGADASLVRLIGTIVALSEAVRDGKKPEDVY